MTDGGASDVVVAQRVMVGAFEIAGRGFGVEVGDRAQQEVALGFERDAVARRRSPMLLGLRHKKPVVVGRVGERPPRPTLQRDD